MDKIAPETLRELLECDPEMGTLVWRPRELALFVNARAANRWNTCHAGRVAFNTLESKGYLSGKLLGRRLKAHRVIWAMVHDTWPDEIDHINGDKSDNRISNLRSVTHSENGRNCKLSKSNTHGFQGIHRRRSGRWSAYISIDGKRAVIGTFDTKDRAIAARQQAERDYGYHPNHGRKAHNV